MPRDLDKYRGEVADLVEAIRDILRGYRYYSETDRRMVVYECQHWLAELLNIEDRVARPEAVAEATAYKQSLTVNDTAPKMRPPKQYSSDKPPGKTNQPYLHPSVVPLKELLENVKPIQCGQCHRRWCAGECIT